MPKTVGRSGVGVPVTYQAYGRLNSRDMYFDVGDTFQGNGPHCGPGTVRSGADGQQMRPGFWGPEQGLGEQGSRKGVHKEVALDSAPCSVLSNLCGGWGGVGWYLCITKWESILSQISIHGEILGCCPMKTGLCHAGEIVCQVNYLVEEIFVPSFGGPWQFVGPLVLETD